MAAKVYVGCVDAALIVSRNDFTDVGISISNLSWNTTDDSLRQVSFSARLVRSSVSEADIHLTGLWRVWASHRCARSI